MDPYRDVYRSSICRTCKKALGLLARHCARCKVVSYCGKEHQLEDWKNHKALCKVIANEHKYLEYNVTNFEELQKYKQQRGLLWQLKLGRKLTKVETQMFMFPRVCAICFKQESLSGCPCNACLKNESIFDCPKCQSEFYCSKEHQEKHNDIHKKYCKTLKLSLDMDCYLYDNDTDINILSIKEVKEGVVSMPKTLDFISNFLESGVPTTDLSYLHSCDQILSGVTILFALEQVEVVQFRKLPKQSLEIHIVGATAFEVSLHWALIIEIFFHWIMNLEEIHIVFIGPEVINCGISFQKLKTQFCQNCRNRNNLVIKEAQFYNCLYHEKVGHLKKPDVVVAFNSGLHEFYHCENDSWKDSLSSLVQNPEAPLVLTAYTYDEIEQDLQRMKEASKIKVVYGPTKNPFSNLRPFQDWATENIPIYFINNFLTIIKKDKSV